jgi:hypothetical protein
MQRKADITRLRQLIDWEPKIPMEEGLDKTIADFKQRLARRPHVVVFTPAYLPLKGPAEEAVSEIIQRSPAWEFDIITSRLDPKLAATEHHSGVNIYRLGSGRLLDKYLLPWRAAWLARRLHKQHNYQVAWAIMASYGAVAAAIFSMFAKVPFLLSVYEGAANDHKFRRGRLLSPIYRFIFRAAHRWQLVGKMNEQQRAWLEDERNAQIIVFDQNWTSLAKRTKEVLQELEILATRM